MVLKRRVSLGGEQLDSLDDRIIITGIDEAAGKDNITAVGSAAGFGQRITGQRRDTLDVTVKFALNIKNTSRSMMADREELLEKINAWAVSNSGGWLRIGHKPGRRLRVMLAQAPGAGDMYNWSNEFTMVFRAYSIPFWEDNAATEMTPKGVTNMHQFYIDVPGNTDTVMDMTVENKSGKTINNITLTVGGKKISFSGLGLGGSESLVIDHVHTGKKYYFRATAGGKSALAKRTGQDDFYVTPGKTLVKVEADRAVKVTASVRGRYI